MTVLDNFVIPIVGSIIAGMAIGMEREWRSRPAGMRTHTLVCLSSALLMVAAVSQADWTLSLVPGERIVTDPTRMAHGILTGIGFLCAGAIFREGFTVQGLATATSLWMTAGLGMLFGIGLFDLAVAGTLVTLAVLVLFRMSYRWLPRRSGVDITLCTRSDPGLDLARLGRVLSELDLSLIHQSIRVFDGGVHTEFNVRVVSRSAMELDRVASALAAIDGVVSFEINPHEDHHA